MFPSVPDYRESSARERQRVPQAQKGNAPDHGSAWLCRALLVCCLLLVSTAHAAEGSVPYAALYQRFAPAQVLQQYPSLRAVQRIESRLANVRPGDIRIWIEADAGRIDVPVDGQGRASFPLTEQLLAENPSVRSNQPQGSLQLQLGLEVQLPGSGSVPYTEVWQSINEAQDALARLGPDYADSEVVGIEYQFVEGPMRVRLAGREIELDLLADDQGRVMLRRDQHWLDADVQVRFEGRLAVALPRLR